MSWSAGRRARPMPASAAPSCVKSRIIPPLFKVDPRGNLYLRYLPGLTAPRPLALLVENVPDILHYGHHNVVEKWSRRWTAWAMSRAISLINSAFHGCPAECGTGCIWLDVVRNSACRRGFLAPRASCACRAAMPERARWR